MNNTDQVKIIYYSEPTDLFWVERGDAGFLQAIRVELPGGAQYPVYFHSIGNLKAELDRYLTDPTIASKYIAEPGLIVIPEITPEYIKIAVEKLYHQGYFDCLRPITGRLLVDNNQNLEPRAKARYAFHSLFNNYLDSQNVNLTFTMVSGGSWFCTLIDQSTLVVPTNVYFVEDKKNVEVNFEILFDPKRGGVIALKSLPSSLSHGYDILIPNEQIAHVEKE